ncbi:DedA family protein [Paenibacillus spiritus]|uniref:DedA family protein n=1 Tax=Paenibacillus spiritus TaxID=2496557 RepID=A0A5J5GIK2_9BACL|nr:DedA family protein [Paenibacillus spiritus]KAA9007528.1 DedA family protein [Paenibacillus spiritus]
MRSWITDFMEQFGYLGIFLMLALENVFPPIPSEVILPFGGFMTIESGLSIAGVTAAATAGSLLGAAILYGVGRLLDRHRLERLVEKYGRVLRIRKEDIGKAQAWFDRYGYWTVLFCRVIPLVRSLISVPAGMSGMKFAPFMLLTAAGSLLWNLVLVLIGAALGESWHHVSGFMEIYSGIVYAAIAGAILLIGYWFLRRRRAGQTR